MRDNLTVTTVCNGIVLDWEKKTSAGATKRWILRLKIGKALWSLFWFMKKNMSGCHTKLFLLDILLFSNQTKERETIFSIFVVSVLFEADLDRTPLPPLPPLLLLLLLVKPLIQDKYLN